MILTRRWLPKSTARRLPLGVTTFLATITLRTHKTTSSLLRPSASIGSPSPTPSRLIVPRATFARSDKRIVDNSAPSDKGNLPNRPIFLRPTGTSLGPCRRAAGVSPPVLDFIFASRAWRRFPRKSKAAKNRRADTRRSPQTVVVRGPGAAPEKTAQKNGVPIPALEMNKEERGPQPTFAGPPVRDRVVNPVSFRKVVSG